MSRATSCWFRYATPAGLVDHFVGTGGFFLATCSDPESTSSFSGSYGCTGMTAYSPRVETFREEMIRLLPRVPNDRASLATMHAMTTRDLISAFVTWRMRLIPARPRIVRLWSGGITPVQFHAVRPQLQPLLQKVRRGEDLTPHLSDLVSRKGIVLPQARRAGDRERHDIDTVLIRHSLHHFHVGPIESGNPKGRSAMLVFAEVLEKEFRIVAASDHSAFHPGRPEFQRIFRIASAYVAKDVPLGQAFMSNPVMSSGHAALVMLFGVRCEDQINRTDPQLDDPAFVDKLYEEHAIFKDGERVPRPGKPSFVWSFQDLKFGFLERTTKTFFCLSPFFAR